MMLGKPITLRDMESVVSIKTKIKLIFFLLALRQKRTSSGVAHLRGVAPEQHISKETLQRWQAVGDTLCDITDPGIERRTSRTNSDVRIDSSNGRFSW